jgi:5-formyltetrahydrofolate cyclo-ligase
MHESDLRNAKNALRKSMKSLLASMDDETKQRLSSLATENFMALEHYKTATIVLAFLSMKQELQTKVLIEKAMAEGKIVAVPRMGFSAGKGDFLEFVPLPRDFDSWPLDRFGIPEPPVDAQLLSMEVLGKARVVVAVPGLVFDLKGGRMGRGKGYYDRFLASMRASATQFGGSLTVCGICFESQIVEAVPMGPWDQRVDLLATEISLRNIG